MERWVKDSNECTHSGKEDHVASLITVCRSVIIFEYKYEAKETAKHIVLRGNQFLSSGKIGTRIYKGTGVVESQLNKISDVRGRHYIAVVIKRTIERSKSLEQSPQQIDKRKQIRTQLTSRADQLRTKRTEHTIKEYACAAYQDSPQKPYNTIQRQTGSDITII